MSSPTDLLVVALEASADLHGAAVLRELRARVPGLRAFGAGGPRMRAEGFEALVRSEDISVMGLTEVVPALPRVLDAMQLLRDEAKERKVTAALLIDSPDFNLRLARKLKLLRVRVAYFIGPSVWAWRTHRVKQIARDVDRMLVILPFEAEFYGRHGVSATYVGNPLADRPPVEVTRDRDLLALLPGSRLQEVTRLWPVMLGAARALRAQRPALRLICPVAPGLDRALLHAPDVELVDGDAPRVLAQSFAAVVASGTATLEAALALTPCVVVYKMSALSFAIGKRLVRVEHVSLINLLAGARVVPELLQGDCTEARIAAEVAPLLEEGAARTAQLGPMQKIRDSLLPGATGRVAAAVAELLQ